jgi:hypothetical protein
MAWAASPDESYLFIGNLLYHYCVEDFQVAIAVFRPLDAAVLASKIYFHNLKFFYQYGKRAICFWRIMVFLVRSRKLILQFKNQDIPTDVLRSSLMKFQKLIMNLLVQM